MESQDVSHDEYQTGECHSSTWEGRLNEMKAANEAQNVKFNEFPRRTEQQLLDLNTTLQTILAQASDKGKRNCKYSDLDLPAEKRARTSVECLQRECPSAQGSSGARTSVECPTDQRQVSELFSDSTSDTRPYGISSEEDLRTEECVVPDPNNIEDEIRLLCNSKDKDTRYAEEEDAENAFLEDISQELSVKDAVGKPLNSSRLASIANIMFIVNMDEEKFKALHKKYNVPENCPNIIVPKCNGEIWKNNLTSPYRINEIRLQNIQNLTVKAAYAVTEACDKILNKMGKMKQELSKELVSPLIDGLAFLGKAITDMNQFRRNNLKPRLPEKLKPLADNVPSESQWLFGDDLSKRISQINNMNSALTQSFRSYQQNNGRYNNSSHSGYSYSSHQKMTKNSQPSRRSSAQGRKGQKLSSNRFYKN